MKKYLSIIAIAAVACASSAFAQGTVGFQNSSSSLVQQWTDNNNSTLISVPKGAGFVQLFYAPAGTAFTPWDGQSGNSWINGNAGWTLSAATPIAPIAGRYSGGVITLAGIAAGNSFDFVLLGWTGAAADFDAAIAGGDMAGVSAKYTLATLDPLLPPPTLANADGFAGFSLAPVSVIPEPSTFALAGLGAAALLIFRRRS